MTSVEQLAKQIEELRTQNEALTMKLNEALERNKRDGPQLREDHQNENESDIHSVTSSSAMHMATNFYEPDIKFPLVTEATPDFDGLDKPSTSKLIAMATRLKSDLSNYNHWETQLLNVFDNIDIDMDRFQSMINGTLRPTKRLNKAMKTVITSTISSDDQILQSLVRPYSRGMIPECNLNSAVAIYMVIKNYYLRQAQNRTHVLMTRIRQLKFNGNNLIKFNVKYLQVYSQLVEMECTTDTKLEVSEYVYRLGTDEWVKDLKKTLATLDKQHWKLKVVMELAVKMFLIQYPEGHKQKPNVFSVRDRSNRTNHNACEFCGSSHSKGKCPAYGVTCSYCGKANHFKKVCKKLKRNNKYTRKQSQQQAIRITPTADNSESGDLEAAGQVNAVNLWAKVVGCRLPNRHKILIDSGASVSVTGRKEILGNFTCEPENFLDTAGSQPIRVYGKGKLRLDLDCGIIEIVCLYSPDIAKANLTLLSVSDLNREGLSIIFGTSQKGSYLERNGSRHYLESYNNCSILQITGNKVPIVTQTQWYEWHERMAHVSAKKMKDTLGDLMHIMPQDTQCSICLEANANIASYKTNRAVVENWDSNRFQTEPNVLYADYKVLSNGYLLHLLIDDWQEIFFLTTKSEAAEQIMKFIATLEKVPKKISADMDIPWDTHRMQVDLARLGIGFAPISPLHHQLNPVETRIRYSMEKIRSIILSLDLPEGDELDFMRLIANYVSFTINRVGKEPTAFERRYGKKTDIQMFRKFFCDCIIPKLNRSNNLQPKGMKVKFVGYVRAATNPTCLLWNPETGSIIRRAFVDVEWVNNAVEKTQTLESELHRDPFSDYDNDSSSSSDDAEANILESNEELLPLDQSYGDANNVDADEVQTPQSAHTSSDSCSQKAGFPNWSHMRGTRLDHYGSQNSNGLRRSRRLMVNAILSKHDVHFGHDLRRASPEVKQVFQQPIENEVKNLQKHKVLEEVHEVPAEAKIINSQFVLNVKRNGQIKARWVACGNQQIGLPPEQVYAPTINRGLLLLLLKLALQNRLEFTVIDVTAAYLYGKLKPEEQVYMRAPYPLPAKIYKVIGNLYGLKQAGKIWNEFFTSRLQACGLQQSALDPCLFFKIGPSLIFLLLHVDDGLLLAKKEDGDRLLRLLTKTFKVTISNDSDFLGIQIMRNNEGSLLLNQCQYIDKILQKYGFEKCTPVPTPLTPQTQLKLAGHNAVVTDLHIYQSMLGSLNYCRYTRPDLLFALHELASVASRPDTDALTAMKRTFRYLLGTRNFGLKVTKENEPHHKHFAALPRDCFVDASYGSGVDAKSIAGHAIFHGGTLIFAEVQPIAYAVDSSAHAEGYGLYYSLRNIQFVNNILHELQQPRAITTIYTDSKALRDFSFKSGAGKRSRHWNLKLHYMKKTLKNSKSYEIKFCPATANVADIFTKPLGRVLFHQLRTKCGLTTIDNSKFGLTV